MRINGLHRPERGGTRRGAGGVRAALRALALAAAAAAGAGAICAPAAAQEPSGPEAPLRAPPPVARAGRDAPGRPAAVRAESLDVARLDGRRARLRLRLSAPAPWRAFHLAAPDRLVFDFDGLDWSGVTKRLDPKAGIEAVRFGLIDARRSRLVLDLGAPMRIRDAVLREVSSRESGAAPAGELDVLIERADAREFAATAGWPEDARPARPAAPPRREGPPVVVIDPGHGGIDPGAIRGETLEKDLVLAFSEDLRDAFAQTGRWRPVMTRTEDVFLTLRDRVAFAEEAGAALFLSIHVNALPAGEASGASIHTLSPAASDEEAHALAVFENRSDVLAGLELAGEGDDVVRVLVDLSRRRTDRASQALAGALVDTLSGRVAMLEGREHSRAGFRVLKSPQIPSALIELGFMSTASDLERIEDPAWRAGAAAAIARAATRWLDRREAAGGG